MICAVDTGTLDGNGDCVIVLPVATVGEDGEVGDGKCDLAFADPWKFDIKVFAEVNNDITEVASGEDAAEGPSNGNVEDESVDDSSAGDSEVDFAVAVVDRDNGLVNLDGA